MKIRLLVTGKTDEEYIKAGVKEYEERIRRYVPFERVEIPGLKNTVHLGIQEWKAREAAKILPFLSPQDVVVLLDEKGKEMSSLEFSAFLRQRFNTGSKNLVFVVGGPYGFDDAVKKRAGFTLSLSRMTFSHQMVRLFFLEQLYRALTILRNESYHHE